MRRLGVVFVGILMMALTAAAQVNVRGQFLLPNGDVPQHNIQFTLTSGDGRVNEIRYSDSNGRFVLERLSGLVDYTIRVDSDNSTYGNTDHNFQPGQSAQLRVTLRPLVRKPSSPAATLSAASGYKPVREAANAHEAALKEITKQQFEAAEANLRKAISLDPKFAAPMIDLGALLMQQKRYSEAEQILRQALEADPKSVLANLNMGVTLNRQSKFADAMPYLREALRLEPGLVAAHLNLGIALVETDQFAEAEAELVRAARTPGAEEIGALLYLGKLYARTGEFAKGIAALESYLAKSPGAPNTADVRSLIDRMRRELAAKSGRGQ